MYFSGKPYFTGNREITTISEKRTDTQRLKPKSRKKGKSTRKKKAKQKYNLTQLKKQLGNDMVIKLLLRLVEGKAGARPVGRPPQQIPSTKQPRKMRLARGSGLPPRQKQKLEKKKQGETEQQFFRRVEDYVMENNPAFLYFSQILQQDRERAEALIREQINAIRNQPVVIREAQERQADVDKDFVNELLRRLRVAEGSSSVDRQKIVREGLRKYSEETGDRLVSSDEDFFYDLARTRGKKKRQEAESRIQQRFVKTGAPRRKARKRVVEEERTTTLGELGGEALSSAESSLISGFTSGETSGGEALGRFQQTGSFRRPPDNPYDRGSGSDIPTSPDEEAERLRGVGRPRFSETGKETKAQRRARLRAEAERRRLEEQGFSSTSESSVGLDKPVRVVKTTDLPRQPEPERQPESGSEASFPAAITETPADPSELAERVRQAERERRFAPLQQADTGEIETAATEPSGKVGSKAVARTGRSPTGIQQKQKSLVDSGLSALTNEGNRVGQELMGSVAQGLIGAKRKATGILSQAQTSGQFAKAGRAYELEHGVFGRRGLLDDVMDDEKRAQSKEFQRRFSAQTKGEGEFSSEGEEAGKGYDTEGSGAEEIEDYFGEEREEQQQETKVFDPEALRAAGAEQREYLREQGQDVETSSAETSLPPDLEPQLPELQSSEESGFTTDATTDFSEEERDIPYDKLLKLKPKAQKKVFKRLQGQVKRSDYELETSKAELQSFKDLTDKQEQLEADLQSLPVKKRIAEQAGRVSEVERLEQQYNKTLQDYKQLDLSGGDETDELLSDLNKSYYSGSESSGIRSSVVDSALSDFESDISAPVSGSSLGESDLALLANTSFRGRARSDITVSEVDEPKPEPEPAPQTFKAVGRENIESIARKQKGREELPVSKRFDAKLKKLDQDIKLIDSNFETDIETPEVRRGINAQLEVSRLLENEIPVLEAELEGLNKDERKLIEARSNAELFLLSLTGSDEQKEVYRKKNEGKDLPDVSSIPASKREEMIAEYQRIIDETNELVKPYQRYRARIQGEIDDTKGLLTTRYKGYIGAEYQQKFTTRANAIGAKVEASSWDSYEKMILDQLVKEGKLSQEEADAINKLDHKRKQDVKQKLLDKAEGAPTRRKWLYSDASTSATDGGWWKGYIKDARKDLARERGEVSVGRPRFTEAELQAKALENANQFEMFARNLYPNISSEDKIKLDTAIEKLQASKQYKQIVLEGKGGKEAFRDLLGKAKLNIFKTLNKDDVSRKKKVSKRNTSVEEKQFSSFSGEEVDRTSPYLKYNAKDDTLRYTGDKNTIITTISSNGNQDGSIYRAETQDGNTFNITVKGDKYIITLYKADETDKFVDGYIEMRFD